MNRHSSEGAASRVPSRSKKAPTVSGCRPAPVTESPQSPRSASEVSVPLRQDQGSAAPPTPPALLERWRKLPPRQPKFARPAKANSERQHPTNSRANAPPAPAIPDNKNTRTSKLHKPRGSPAKPPARAPTASPASKRSRIRCAPRAPRARAENQSLSHAQKIKSAAKAKSTPPPQKM